VAYYGDLLGKDLRGNIRAKQDGKIDEFRIDKNRLKSIAAYGLSLKKGTVKKEKRLKTV
jgi:hypothetical protein